jgi:xanthine dehydrogenase accessory factor
VLPSAPARDGCTCLTARSLPQWPTISLQALALEALAAPLGFRVHRSFENITTLDAWVVAAGMSSDEDLPAVREALARGVRYVAMVASRRRTAALVEELRDEGVTEDVIERLKSPAGLDFGAATGPEIALSILAEIVQRRRSRPRATSGPTPAQTALDPICGMQVEVATAKWTVERGGETYYFCAPGCRRTFLSTAPPF